MDGNENPSEACDCWPTENVLSMDLRLAIAVVFWWKIRPMDPIEMDEVAGRQKRSSLSKW